MSESDKEIRWLGSTLKDLSAMPDDVKRPLGYGLRLAQKGERAPDAKTLKGYDGAVELIENHDGDTYRAVYTTRIDSAVYVLHCFQKKSTSGIAIPKHDKTTIESRLKDAKRDAEDQRSASKSKGH